ncbi:VOC family protein [Arcicella aquatica]|uniref:VOC family protein n=1 Tax=Arcicella aquatica TaxID=217141 RepID=A0ABU5QIR6_9BACT|nr:VOC family protein [Arcicella aquatica]MEA5256928.1 VOC family protein [Arcicella aquatica]
MESLTVNTFVKDINKSIEFYKQIGFETIMTVPEEGDFVWVMLSNGGVTIMLQTMDSLGEELPDIDRNRLGGSLLFYIKLKQIRDFFESIKDKVEVVKGLEKTFYGATEFTIKDIDGYYLTFAEDEA